MRDQFDVDLVLIDDDPIIRQMWEIASSELNLSLLSVSIPNNAIFTHLDRATPVFVDLFLGSYSGLDVLDLLHDLGFKNLYLTTGNESRDLPKRQYLKGLLGKEVPDLAHIIGKAKGDA